MLPAVWVRSAAAGALLAAACGGGGASPDAGTLPPPRLEVLSPPGDQIGVAPGDAVTLRVRLTTAAGEPIAQAPVTFALLGQAGQGGGTGGATLTAAQVATDVDGIAEDNLTTGPVRVDFQVAADAPDAPRALFYVSVSAEGFADARVTPTYTGDRPATDVDRVELRAYRGDVPCAGLDPDALPAPTLAPRTLPAFGGTASWPGLPAGEAFTVVAQAIHPTSDRAIAFGCASVDASQVAVGPLAVTLGVGDRPLTLADGAVASDLDLSVVAGLEASAGTDRPWQILACPDGGGQLVLDWIVDALAADGALDGQTQGLTGDAAAIEAARGALGTDGCRAATVAGGGASLDALLEASLAQGPFPAGAARAQLEASRLKLFGDVALSSTLGPAGPGRFHHALAAVTVGSVSIDLAASARPVVSAEAPWTLDHGELTLGGHAFTARLGSALGDGFRDGPLATAGLDGDAAALGQALVGSARHTPTLEGCAAVDAVVCAPAGLAAGCVAAACPAAAAGLDGALTAWWRALDGDGLDLALVGHATAADTDGDLQVDGVTDGRWDVALTLASGQQVDTNGTWTSPLTIAP
jgi:hypothetical protein